MFFDVRRALSHIFSGWVNTARRPFILLESEYSVILEFMKLR